MSVHPWLLYTLQLAGLLLAMWGSYLYGRHRQHRLDVAAVERWYEQRFMDEVED